MANIFRFCIGIILILIPIPFMIRQLYFAIKNRKYSRFIVLPAWICFVIVAIIVMPDFALKNKIIMNAVTLQSSADTVYTDVGYKSVPLSSDESETVYVTSSGTSYHRSDCSRMPDNAMPITKRDAEDSGYKPCKICHSDK